MIQISFYKECNKIKIIFAILNHIHLTIELNIIFFIDKSYKSHFMKIFINLNFFYIVEVIIKINNKFSIYCISKKIYNTYF